MAYVDVDKFADAICNFPAIDEQSANAVISLLRRQPTADVEKVKHGEWKKISVSSEHGYGQVYYQHSSCEINSTELFQCPYERCPRCGTKMDGGAE